jgi:DNA-directed RNA polymerase specialized sigma24 family protein
MSKQCTLHQSELDALLAWLAPAREQAGEKYEAIRQTLTKYFEWRQCVPADEHVDETIDRVARRLWAGEQIRTTDPYRYFHGVARHVWQESRRCRLREMQSWPHMIAMREQASPQSACLAHCLATLSPEARELLEAYYLDPRGDLAARLGITPNALRIRVFKEKQKLKSCAARCLKALQPVLHHVDTSTVSTASSRAQK